MAGVLAGLAIAAGIGTGIKTGAGMYQASKIYSKEDEERLKELERLEAAGQLGLTDNERERLYQRASRPGLASERQSRDTLAAQQSIADTGAGQAAKQQAAITDISQKQKGRVAEQVEQQAMLAQQQDLAEMAALREREKEEDRQFWGALAGGAAESVEGIAAYQHAKYQETNRIQQKRWMSLQADAMKNQTKYLDAMAMRQMGGIWGSSGTTVRSVPTNPLPLGYDEPVRITSGKTAKWSGR
jgi:hypothetical protein